MTDQPPEDDADLTLEEARAAASEMASDLYLAQDTLSWVRELCDIRDQTEGALPGGGTVTTAEVRQWLNGPQCGRMLGLLTRADPSS